MTTRIYFVIIFLATVPLWGQEEGTVAETPAMTTPPPVSGEAYATEGASLARSNYVSGGLTFNSAYTDNLLGGLVQKPVSDVSYSVWPTIALDETTPRLHTTLTYSPGFTFYQRTSAYDQANQNVGVALQYRLSPHVTLSVGDSLHKLSSVFNQPDLLAVAPVSGSTQPAPIAVIAPTADQLYNTGYVEVTDQFSRNAMVGASGTLTNLHYSDLTQVSGLYNSNSKGGSAFYTHRLSRKHYVGATYQYTKFVATRTEELSETQSHSVLLFYTFYFKPTLSLSFSGGPQHVDVGQPLLPVFQAWSPSGAVSLGWQGRHTAFAASYSRAVAAGGGLIGGFNSNNAALSARQQLTRQWSAGLSGGYSIYKPLNSPLLSSNSGGHTISGSASIQRTFGTHLNAELGYTRLYQSYGGIAAVSTFPNVNREAISISYQFARPLGR